MRVVVVEFNYCRINVLIDIPSIPPVLPSSPCLSWFQPQTSQYPITVFFFKF